MNDTQKRAALKITKKITNFSISAYFLRPVDPILDNVPDYLDKIKKPMDLQTVITHLEDGTYQTIDEWKKDVNLIWKNAMSYHLEGSYIFSIAKELSDVFKKLCEGIPKSEIEMWTNKIRKTQAKLVKLINSKPGLIEKSASLNASKQRPTKILLRQKTN